MRKKKLKGRYTKQRNLSGCGPVAILNAIKWANPDKLFSYKEYYPLLAEACKTTLEGTNRKNFKQTLFMAGKTQGFTVKELKCFDWNRVRHHLYMDGAVILGHAFRQASHKYLYEEHYSFWFAPDRKTVCSVNRNPLDKQALQKYNMNAIVDAVTESHAASLQKVEIYLISKKDTWEI